MADDLYVRTAAACADLAAYYARVAADLPAPTCAAQEHRREHIATLIGDMARLAREMAPLAADGEDIGGLMLLFVEEQQVVERELVLARFPPAGEC